MTVAELIEILKTYPQNDVVVNLLYGDERNIFSKPLRTNALIVFTISEDDYNNNDFGDMRMPEN